MAAPTDLLGRPLTEPEARLLAAYDALSALAARTDLPPCAHAAVAEARASLWQAANDLLLVTERPS
jgi:hypothetical protein